MYILNQYHNAHFIPIFVLWPAMFFAVRVEVWSGAHAAIGKVAELVNVKSVLPVFKAAAEFSLNYYRSIFRCLNRGD